jgi:hypothetical protein
MTLMVEDVAATKELMYDRRQWRRQADALIPVGPCGRWVRNPSMIWSDGEVFLSRLFSEQNKVRLTEPPIKSVGLFSHLASLFRVCLF